MKAKIYIGALIILFAAGAVGLGLRLNFKARQRAILQVWDEKNSAAKACTSVTTSARAVTVTNFDAREFGNKLAAINVQNCPADFQTAWKKFNVDYAKSGHFGFAKTDPASAKEASDLKDDFEQLKRISGKYKITLH